MTATVYADPAALFLRMLRRCIRTEPGLLDLHRLHQLPRLLPGRIREEVQEHHRPPPRSHRPRRATSPTG